MAVAETTPLASDVDTTLVRDTAWGVSGCQTTATLGIGLPAASSTRAVSGVDKGPGGPDWLLPLKMCNTAGWATGGGWITVIVKTVLSETGPVVGPKGVCTPPVVCNTTCAGPGLEPSVTVAEPIPFPSEADAMLLSVRVDDGRQPT